MNKISSKVVTRCFTITMVISCLLFLHLPLSAKENNTVNLNTVNLLLTAEDEPWLLPIAVPLLANLQKKINHMIFLAVIPTYSREQEQEVALASRIAKANTLLLATKSRIALSPQDIHLAGQTITLPNNRTKASLQIAQQFGPSSHKVIAAWVNDAESAIIGATLAAHYAVPFLFFSYDLPARELKKQLNALKVKQILFINKQRFHKLSWLDKHYQVSRLSPAQMTPLLVQQLGHNVENILLARVPKLTNEIGKNTWLVPYISLQRKSLPLLLTTNAPSQIENQVTQLIQKYTLKPSTITLLGESSAIGLYDYEIENASGNGSLYSYDLPVEILTYPQYDQALSFGVGRIPFNQLYQTATLFARGLYREQLIQQQSHRILMVANSIDESDQIGGLPLCETISRATSQELRNFSLNVDEFYRHLSNSPAIMDASQSADMIIFQGHAYHQNLVDDPGFFFQLETADIPSDEIDYIDHHKMGQAQLESEENLSQSNQSPFKFKANDFFETDRATEAEETVLVDQFNPIRRRFNGLPIVILQSCNSLQDQISDWLLQLGGSAIIGSVSNIHSASGSSFIKTLIDRTLYQGETLGTALRDARNYFYVLQDLKNQRGHREQAKSLRVALSFRLWGDPQLKVFKPLSKPLKPTLSVVWNNAQTLTITTPTKHLPKIKTEKYIAYGYPGVQYAGLVKRLKKQTARKVIPLYFVKTPLPAHIEKYQSMTVLKGKKDRVAYRIDPQTKQLYLVYLTQKENKYPILRFKFQGK